MAYSNSTDTLNSVASTIDISTQISPANLPRRPPLHPGIPKLTTASISRFREESLLANISMQLAMSRREKKNTCCHRHANAIFYSTCTAFYLGTVGMAVLWVMLKKNGY